MEPILLTKYEAPLSGGPPMNVRRLAHAATLCANALRVNGERFLRELKTMAGAEGEDVVSLQEEHWNRLETHLGERGADQATDIAELIAVTLDGIREIEERFSNIPPSAAGAGVEESTLEPTPVVPASEPDAATDAAAAAGSGVLGGGGEASVPTTTEPTREAPGGAAVEGGGAPTPAVAVPTPSSPGDAPGDVSAAAVGDGPSLGKDELGKEAALGSESLTATEVAAPSGKAAGGTSAGKPRGKRR